MTCARCGATRARRARSRTTRSAFPSVENRARDRERCARSSRRARRDRGWGSRTREDARAARRRARTRARAARGDDARDALDGTTLDDGVDVEREGRTTRDGATGTKLWMTCDGIVFVVSAEASTREMGTEGGARANADAPATSEDANGGRRERKDDAVAGTEAERTDEGAAISL